MTLTINLAPDMEQKLRERATSAGQTLEGFVQQLLERELQEGNGAHAPAGATIDEILRPVQVEFEASGMTEEQLTAFLTEVRDEVRHEAAEEGPVTAPLPGAVFDCVVLLQAAISHKGPAHVCNALLDAGRLVVFISPAVVAEITDVLNRPKLRQKFEALTPERAEAFLRNLTEKATCVEEVHTHFAYPRDPDDEPYLNLAITAGARYLVTWDNDLLDLMADNPAGADFRNRFPGLVILTPVAFLREFAPPPGPEAAPAEPPAGDGKDAANAHP